MTAVGPALPSGGTARSDREIWSTTATVVVTDPEMLSAAGRLLDLELLDVEYAASRFRRDSEIAMVNRCAGSEVTLSATLNELVAAALRAARITGGLVDPTVAAAVIGVGYDRTIGDLRNRDIGLTIPATGPRPSPGIGGARHDPVSRRLLVPRGVGLDLGATAKAWAADHAAGQIHAAVGCGVLVSIGGDVAVAGQPPAGGWRVAVGDDHRTAEQGNPVVTIRRGALATSSTSVRRWRTTSGVRHHIVDPRTGDNPEPFWRTASAVADSAVDANAATTAAIVLGREAADWLDARGIAARLVGESGTVKYLAGWPADAAAVA
ncbi:FAD:protein FMN transferase [Nakamurella lactea]|uniref:FAD:protein FMN transferase n=1 Tax=Nakamurella lactea TaxID=459515 RepID=UPI0004067E2C|nr:FAD:protein FMN transferase [Nakamurella lactea]